MMTFRHVIQPLIGVLFLAGNVNALSQELSAVDTELSISEKALVDWVDQRQEAIIAELKAHVEINTGTDNVSGINAYRGLLQKDLEALGFATTTTSSPNLKTLSCRGDDVQIADHLVARMNGDGPKLLLNGHMDTVFSPDDEFQTMIVEADGTIKGPGVADMKGGIVVMLNALRALKSAGLLEQRHLTVLLNSDEEIGSLGSRSLIEELAKEHDLGIVFEGSYKNQLTRARKGLGQARIKVTGRESHAGAAHQEGVSANLELAHKVIAIEALTDYDEQSTVNVGVMSGGEKRNTIPGCAEAYVDMRYTSNENGEALKSSIIEVAEKNHIRNSSYPDYPVSETWAVLHRPAKPEHVKVDELIQQAMGLSSVIGEPIVGARYSGGGTDGSIAQNVGLPTVDSLGVDGSGAHSVREETTVSSLIARTKLVSVMLARLLADEG